ncbi:dcsD [Symbiodinium sp. CCMP2456]|nr:dcsD [Symbiodinium sp. CCMP2456]
MRFNYTNYPPFKAYGVEGWWLDNLLKAGKLSRKAYLKLAAQVTVGFQKRLADCKAAERYLHDETLQDAIRAHAKALEPATLPMKSFPVIEAWRMPMICVSCRARNIKQRSMHCGILLQEFVACHDGSSRFRRPILAIVGGTRLGKSMLAAHTLQHTAQQLGLPEYLEVAFEESEQMDLAEFDRRIHAGVILDGVGDALFLKRHREALQSRAKMVKVRATNVYSYAYSFCGRAVVATFDLSAQNLGELESDHWLCNRDNDGVVVLPVGLSVHPTHCVRVSKQSRLPALQKRHRSQKCAAIALDAAGCCPASGTPDPPTAGRGISTSVPRRAVYNNITEAIGKTPVIKVNRLAPAGINLYVKCEYFNPLSSVKAERSIGGPKIFRKCTFVAFVPLILSIARAPRDRLAIAIIEDAEQRGELKPGGTVVEATSGNTGIALAMVCAQRGYKFVSTMAASFSVERRKVMRMLGAKVVVTPAPLGGTGMVLKAEELAEKHGWYLARQFENEANPAYHAKTTGPEILADFEGKSLDYWVTGYGTGGTFQGAGKVLKEARPGLKIILSEPKGAALITSGIKQERKEVLGKFGAPAKGHPAWNPHPIQGWTPNFIPKVTEDGLEMKVHDEVLTVDPQEAVHGHTMQQCHEDLTRFGKDGRHLLRDLWWSNCGNSTGGCGKSARCSGDHLLEWKVLRGSVPWELPPLSWAHCISSLLLSLHMRGQGRRYLSTPLFGDIDAEMNEEEMELAKSTPSVAASASLASNVFSEGVLQRLRVTPGAFAKAAVAAALVAALHAALSFAGPARTNAGAGPSLRGTVRAETSTVSDAAEGLGLPRSLAAVALAGAVAVRARKSTALRATRVEWFRKVKRISGDRAVFDVSIPKPLGLALEAFPDGRGVGISSITPESNADQLNRKVCITEEDNGMWVLEGDRVIGINGTETVDSTVEDIAKLVGESEGDSVTLTLVRNTRNGPIKVVIMPEKKFATVRRNARLSSAVEFALGREIKYGCIDGWCGTCWHRERTTGWLFKPCSDMITSDWDNVMPMVLFPKPEKAGDATLLQPRGA